MNASVVRNAAMLLLVAAMATAEGQLLMSPAPAPAAQAQQTAGYTAEENLSIRRVFFFRSILMLRDNHTLKRDTCSTCALLSGKLNAPARLTEIFTELADDRTTRTQQFNLKTELQDIARQCGFNDTAMHMSIQASGLTPQELMKLVVWLPLEEMYNCPTNEQPTQVQLSGQFMDLLGVYSEMTQVLAGVKDTDSANTAAVQLLPLFRKFGETNYLRWNADLAPVKQVSGKYAIQAESVKKEYSTQHARMEAANYFGSLKLRAAVRFLSQ